MHVLSVIKYAAFWFVGSRVWTGIHNYPLDQHDHRFFFILFYVSTEMKFPDSLYFLKLSFSHSSIFIGSSWQAKTHSSIMQKNPTRRKPKDTEWYYVRQIRQIRSNTSTSSHLKASQIGFTACLMRYQMIHDNYFVEKLNSLQNERKQHQQGFWYCPECIFIRGKLFFILFCRKCDNMNNR